MFLVFETSLTTSLAVLALFGDVLVKARLVTDKFQDGADRYDQAKTLTGRIYGRCNELGDCKKVDGETRQEMRDSGSVPLLGAAVQAAAVRGIVDVFRFSN